MHNYDDNKQGGGNGMMWMMVLCCAIPLILILIFGAGGRALGFLTWIIFGGIAVMIIAHFFMMGRSHKHSGEGHEAVDKDGKNKDNNKSHSGMNCH